MDSDLDTPEGDGAGLSVVTCGCKPDNARAKDLDTLNTDVAPH